MTEEDWDTDFVRSVGMFLNGAGIRGRDRRGQPIVDDNFLVYFNAHHDALDIALPGKEYGPRWRVVVDTAMKLGDKEFRPAGKASIVGRSVLVLQAIEPEAKR
jgi:glycogen operon protein